MHLPEPRLWHLMLLAVLCGVGAAWVLTWAFAWGYWLITGP